MPEALSLAEELEQGFDNAESAVVDTPAADAAPAGDAGATQDSGKPVDSGDDAARTEAADSGRQRGPDGKFVKADNVAVVGKQPADAVGQPTDPARPEGQAQEVSNVVDLPPSTFTPAAKAAYQALPKDSPLRADIKKREADYQKGISQYKQAAEQGNSLMAEIQPYMGIIQSEGGTPQRAIKQLLHTAYQLRSGTPQQRGELVMQIAQQYGADMSRFMGAKPDGEQAQNTGFDPQALAPVVQQLLSPHLHRIEKFQSEFLTAKQREEQAATQAATASVEAFRVAADKEGNPAHPYFDNVRDLMADFINAGHAQDMETAYAMACRAHPEVSQAIASAQTQQQEAQRLAEAKRKAEEARRASSVNASGQGGVGTADITNQTLADELSNAYDAQVGARL